MSKKRSDTITYCLIIAIIVLIILIFYSKNNENYSAGITYADPRMIPEYPTMDHIKSNIWTRYDLDSDRAPYHPYFPHEGIVDASVLDSMYF